MIGYQDVLAIGALFTTGRIDTRRVVALCGPQAVNPRLVQTRIGANINELIVNETDGGDNRVISGSLLSGRIASTGHAGGALSFLGRYHTQVPLILEAYQREFFRYLPLAFKRHSAMPIYLSSLGSVQEKNLSFSTNTNGSERAMVPIGNYEKVMPLDILPTQLLRALIVGHTDIAPNLGCLHLHEDALSLYSYLRVGNYDYCPILSSTPSRTQTAA